MTTGRGGRGSLSCCFANSSSDHALGPRFKSRSGTCDYDGEIVNKNNCYYCFFLSLFCFKRVCECVLVSRFLQLCLQLIDFSPDFADIILKAILVMPFSSSVYNFYKIFC